MAPDDVHVANPASESAGTPKPGADDTSRSIGPESEVRGGHEAPDTTLGDERPRPVKSGPSPSDPPVPPGVPPERPDPDKPTPIEEPPGPIPVPPDEPPPPIVA